MIFNRFTLNNFAVIVANSITFTNFSDSNSLNTALNFNNQLVLIGLDFHTGTNETKKRKVG
jgi:hypothetical protein